MGYERVGLGLHYGRRGIDVYGIRNTPRGKTIATMEVKSTRRLKGVGTDNAILKLLIPDSKGIQQGSRLYSEDRIKKALSYGSRVAAHIRSGQVRAGEGRIWQVRNYVYRPNVVTGESKLFRAFSNEAGNRVATLKLIRHALPKE